MKTKTKRLLTVSVSAVLTACLAGAYIVADTVGLVPGSINGLRQIYREGSIAALNPSYRVLSTRKQTVADIENKEINRSRAQALIDTLESSLASGTQAGIVIANTAGKTVASSHESEAMTPASTLKTLTAFASSVTFSSHETLKTTVKMQKSDSDSTAATVTLVGGGDILLGEGNNDPHHINGRAGLASLADNTVKALQSRGITQVVLQYDDALFNHDSLPSSENSSSDVNQGYMNLMETSSMAVDEARNWAGEPPQNPDGLGSWYPQRSATPAADTAYMFAAALEKRGISVTNSNFSDVDVSSSAFEIAQVESAPIGQIIQLMLTNSDNSLAQLLGRLLALRTKHDNTHAGASQAVADIVKTHGISTESLVMADTSGLADGSSVKPSTLAAIQSAYLNTNGLTWNPAVGLPIAQYSGTLLHRDFTAESSGLVRAKTGTLGEVTSLAGNVSRLGGGSLVFVVVVNGENAAQNIPAINTFVAGLVKL
ncbi:D-alanyl-D-alanine carboxypeptidase [Alloscardovia omnicolens]|uniref:D-alanyl-D-alanine carboxypeptidase n=1 Tax=Alloscardovia omnicolens TaxID=419015 RepID=UPI003A6A9364